MPKAFTPALTCSVGCHRSDIMDEKGFPFFALKMPHLLLQTEKCHNGGTGSWEAASEEREPWEIHFRRDTVRNHQSPAQDMEVKGLRENGQDVGDGQDSG